MRQKSAIKKETKRTKRWLANVSLLRPSSRRRLQPNRRNWRRPRSERAVSNSYASLMRRTRMFRSACSDRRSFGVKLTRCQECRVGGATHGAARGPSPLERGGNPRRPRSLSRRQRHDGADEGPESARRSVPGLGIVSGGGRSPGAHQTRHRSGTDAVCHMIATGGSRSSPSPIGARDRD